jgi:hypothetical protein
MPEFGPARSKRTVEVPKAVVSAVLVCEIKSTNGSQQQPPKGVQLCKKRHDAPDEDGGKAIVLGSHIVEIP